ncbi:hypothetical protein KI387_008533, partial [Taxus chinensis]
LQQYRKQKAEERAKKASAASTEISLSSGIKNSNVVHQLAGSLLTKTQELNGISFEKNPSEDVESHVVQPSRTASSDGSFPIIPSNEGEAPKVFVDDYVKMKSPAAEPIHKVDSSLSIVSDPIYSNRLERPSFKDNVESDRQDIVSSNELDSGYMNAWRRSYSENSSEFSKQQIAKTVSNESSKTYVDIANFFPNRTEQVAMKDEFLLSQEESFKENYLDERNGRAHELLEGIPTEEQVSSSFSSKDAEENALYKEKFQPLTHPGSIHKKNNLLEPEFTGKKYSDERRDFGNGKHGEEVAKFSGEGSEFPFSDRNNNRQSQNQDSLSAQLYSDTKNRPSTTLHSVVNSRHSRPSFLNSITSSTPSATVQIPMAGSEAPKFMGESIQTDVKNAAESSAITPWQSVNNEYEGSKKLGLHDRPLSQLEFSSSPQNDDFAALEQHIEDLTQDKFALQRALDASRTLTESLAQENSSLTEAFNQQGTVVSQLKVDLESQEEEIRAQLLVLNTLKVESENAQLECSAADERAKMLASEVIGLEEKALRLRSNELKLERQLETANDEIASNRRHISSLEKERLDLRSTIDALQEEKKLLQSKLRKAAANGGFDVHKSTKPLKNVKEASTSTEDIGIELFNFPGGSGLFLARQDDATTIIPTSQQLLSTVDVPQVPDVQSTVTVSSTNFSSSFNNTTSSFNSSERHNMLDLPVAIPSDQQRMVDNINSLIEELALEKESLARALKIESAEVTKIRASNQELSQKLESQTQRLELLIAQNMAHGSSVVGPRNIDTLNDEMEYVDEGDE